MDIFALLLRQWQREATAEQGNRIARVMMA
jgi:hypothetical protein